VRTGRERTLPDVGRDEAWFATLFGELSPAVFGYARRQCDLASAQDVVADTFLVAWRRRDVVPDPALPWLLVVARNTIANRRRHEHRQDRLIETVARLASVAAPADHDVGERDAMLRSLAGLSAIEREAVLLVAWDGLSNRDAAAVAGCSVRAFEVRLSRGRARLARDLTTTVVANDDADARPSR
jgi:RNA polymerase sigma factor (sigma-70 family)